MEPSPIAKLLPDAPLAANARWIWAPGAAGANHYVEFRCDLDLPGPADEAWLQLSAETSFRLSVNGTLVHAGPPREIPPYFYFDTLDLRTLLHPGPNELRILAHHQGQDSATHLAGTPALLVAGRCSHDTQTLADFAEVRRWHARPVSRYRADSHRLFSCLGFSEHVVFAAPDAPWLSALTVAHHPWPERPRALPRDLPAFTASVRTAASTIPHEGGWLVDFGQEVSGYVELALESAVPIALRVAYAEHLTAGRVDARKQNMRYFDLLDLPAGPTNWRSYEKRAFRFLHLSAPVLIQSVRVIEHHYPFIRQDAAPAGRAGSDEAALVERIRAVSARTIVLNTEDLLTDCPWRERAQYLDSLFYMGAMQKLFGAVEPLRRFLRQFPRGADAGGLLRMSYPSPPSTLVIPDFSISYALLLHRYFQITGDRPTVQENLALAQRGVTAFRRHQDAAGLLTDVPGWIFLDNTFELPKFPRSAALNAAYYGGHRALAALLRACGDDAQAAKFESQAARLRTAFRSAFVRPDRILDADSTPDHERFHHWVYHFSAETGQWTGECFRLRTRYRLHDAATPLRLAVHAGARAWIDGKLVATIQQGGSWARSAAYQPTVLPTPADTAWHQLDLEVQWSAIDWECYLSCAADIDWSPVTAWPHAPYATGDAAEPVADHAPPTRLRRHILPWMTQVTVGHAAFHGLLDPDEARRFLTACLPERYPFSYAKRTTPFFATIDDAAPAPRILPCNVPASLFYFCHALAQHGMHAAAQRLLLPIYQGMLDRGATTWWEEWNTRSSHCHAWSSFVVEFL